MEGGGGSYSVFLERERATAGEHYPNRTTDQYKRLAHVTLAKIVLFNRRRPQGGAARYEDF